METMISKVTNVLSVMVLAAGLSMPMAAEAGSHTSVNVNVAVGGHGRPCGRPCARPCVKKRRACFKIASCKRSFGCGKSCKRRC